MIDWGTMPGLTSLRAFLVLAETGSVVRAGKALNVSHAAISQQIKALETYMDLSLVDRSKRGLTLTEQGNQLARALSRGFETIADEIKLLSNMDGVRPLQITTTPEFAMNWLMPRLTLFQEQNLKIRLMINPSWELYNPTGGGVDLALRFGAGEWPGLKSELLRASDLVAVAAPELSGDRAPNAPQDLADLPWLQELGVDGGADWFVYHGLNPKDLRKIMVPGNTMRDAARRGQGVWLTRAAHIEPDIKEGTLKLLHQDQETLGYYMVADPKTLRPEVQTFIAWLRVEARKGI